MKKAILLIMVVLIVFSSLLIADPIRTYEPYQENEFPLWTYKLHRAERLFFGSMIITVPVTMIAYSLAMQSGLIAPPATEAQAYLIQGAIAAGLSLGISVTDFIIGEVRGR